MMAQILSRTILSARFSTTTTVRLATWQQPMLRSRFLATIQPNQHYQSVHSFSMQSFVLDLNQSVACSAVVQSTQTSLISLHEYLHLPWFAEIMLVTAFARFCITLPLTINQRRILTRYEQLAPEIEAISKRLKIKLKQESYIYQRSKRRTQSLFTKMLSKEVNRLILRDNCHPIKAAMVPLFQIPVWIILSHSYRNLARLLPDPSNPVAVAAYTQLQQEGLFWFTNLTVPDSIGLLPLCTVLLNLTIIQLHVNERRKANLQDSLPVKIFVNGARLFSLIFIPIGLIMPANMSFYWLVSSSCGLVQNILLLNPRVKKYFNIQINSEKHKNV